MNTLKEFAVSAIEILNNTPNKLWGKTFIDLRIQCFKQYERGLITSTLHGIDFFDNVINCLNGTMEWPEEGQYGDNFRKIIQLNYVQY